ncbi:vomeronasal type-1 receptor 3 [Fukomys damarensis]|uniref:Vomeronasal type-1 receptor n=1 Tax=Fukomys damarensis TaxID=885580 RepID=A0A091E1D0_FUKDA|nr:vomeronasal type-1 receptor 3 [Fukomys damarensis]KFO36513.1 Vomeronasal type-1 receptor 2 [Fukomys damarensis]
MASADVNVGIVFIVQLVLGTLGNFSLLSQDLFLYFSGCTTRPTDSIRRHLTVANLLVILSRGIAETMAEFGLEHFLGDAGCKLVFSVHALGRGVAFGSTCLLSVFQAITISPMDWKWAQFKGKAPKYRSTFTTLCWVLNLLFTFSFVTITSKLETVNITNKIDLTYCSDPRSIRGSYSASVSLVCISDILCMGLMLLASGSMVCILYRHKQQVRHIRSPHVSSRSSPETRATRRVLVLMNIFACLYITSATMRVYLTFSENHSFFLRSLGTFINGLFPTICPFLLLSHGHSVSSISCVCSARSTEPPDHSRRNACTACFSVLTKGWTPAPRNSLKMQRT